MKKIIFTIALIISTICLSAQSVGEFRIIQYDGYSLKFTIINLSPAECEVSCFAEPVVETDILIPASVEISGIDFSVTTIGEDAFSVCDALISVIMPKSVTTIKDWAFSDCEMLKSLEIPANVNTIGDNIIAYSYNLESLVVSEENTIFDSRDNCNAIIKTSSNELFVGCYATVIPESIESIGRKAFSYCGGLTSIVIPEGVHTICENVFVFCDNLTSVELPSTIVTIKEKAFAWCYSLETVTCHAEEVPDTEIDAFLDSPSDIIVHVPAASVAAYQATAPWSDYTIIPFSSLPSHHHADKVSVYPNPAGIDSEIYLGTNCDKVEIYNISGVKIAEYKDVEKIEGINTAGVYLIKTLEGNNINYGRIVVR